MISVPLTLSVDNVRKLTTQIKVLKKSLTDKVATDIEQAVCGSIAVDVIAGIASIQDVDGNYLGTDNPNAAVTVQVGLVGHDVIWRGEQITFVEFGTGAAGAGAGKDATTAAKIGYHPDPTKKAWGYRDARTQKAEVSHGMIPQAPMWNAAIAMRGAGGMIPAKLVLEEALRSAVTV